MARLTPLFPFVTNWHCRIIALRNTNQAENMLANKIALNGAKTKQQSAKKVAENTQPAGQPSALRRAMRQSGAVCKQTQGEDVKENEEKM